MGKSILNTVIDLLNDGGIPAAPAQPAGKMLIVHGPVAAVSIEKVDTAGGFVSVLVEIVGPMDGGAERCQNRALTVCNILSGAGGACEQGSCSFQGKGALFRVPVTARFYGTATEDDWTPRPTCTVKIDGAILEYVESFSAQQVKEEPAEEEEEKPLSSAPWSFTLEESFPVGTKEPADPQEPFFLRFTGPQGSQIFSGCTLTARQRIYTAEGIRQIRKGIAVSRTLQ